MFDRHVPLAELPQRVVEFVSARAWGRFHTSVHRAVDAAESAGCYVLG